MTHTISAPAGQNRSVTPADVLAFWHGAGRDRWYGKDDGFDADIRRRFLSVWHSAVAGELLSWEASDDGALALTIVLDQFPRNMFRGDPQAFASDSLARDIAVRNIARGVDQRVDPEMRQFLYLPLMHSENPADQQQCYALFLATGETENLKFAQDHADIIARFGRFPHRNKMLDRTTTPEEQAFLESGGFAG